MIKNHSSLDIFLKFDNIGSIIKNMELYAFELGRKKDLCFAELVAVLGKNNLVERNLDTAIFKLELKNPQALQDQLGGTIKIVEICYEYSQENIKKLLKDNFEQQTGKIVFSVSTLSFKNRRDINIKEILNFSKIFLKSFNLNSRFVNKGNESPKPSTIYKARVIEKGIDINIIKGEKKIWLGKTISIQNIDNYSKRDYHKPFRDAKVGMTPPKLAQIMINLACKNPQDDIIYDPFCGTGTFLMEALLMEKNVVGSDIDPRMVEYSQKNCQWFKENFQQAAKQSFRVFERDARFLNKNLIPEKIDAIVTEGYLGEPVSQIPSPEEREKTFRELANLHLNWLKAVNPLIQKNSRIVMCVGAFKTHQRIEHLPKFEQLAQTAGYKVVETFTYDRPDQIVARDIKVLEKI